MQLASNGTASGDVTLADSIQNIVISKYMFNKISINFLFGGNIL